MMVVDIHAHLKHGDRRRTEYTPAEILATMDGAGIERSVVFAMCTSAERAIAMAEAAVLFCPARLIPFAYALPNYERPVLDLLRSAIMELGFKGIKLHVGECTLAEYVSGPVFALAGRLGVPCLVDFGGQLEACRAVLSSHPETTVIIAHFGRYLCQDEALVDQFIALAEGHANAYLDTSGVVLMHKIVEAVARLGPGRILFGTDGPHSFRDGPEYASAADTAAFARAAVEGILALPLSSAEKRAILGENAARLLRL